MACKKICVFLVTVACLALTHAVHKAPHHEKHVDGEGHHNPDYDAEAMFGKDAEQFRHMDPDQIHEKLNEYIDKMDLNKDDKISREELTQWIAESYRHMDKENTDQLFVQTDEDQDGKISLDDVLTLNHGHSAAEIDKLDDTKLEAKNIKISASHDKKRFAAADENKDGSLSKDEYYKFSHPHTLTGLSDIETQIALDEYDTNKDKKIDLTEFLAITTFGHTDDPQAHEEAEKTTFSEYDKNKDGFLDFEEVRQWSVPDYDVTAKEEVDHLFHEADANKDGFLSREEISDKEDMFTGSHITRQHEEL